MKREKFVERRWYEFAFLYLWIVLSTILCFGTMLMHFVAGEGINWDYLLFYPGVGFICIVLYLFGFVYARLDKKPLT